MLVRSRLARRLAASCAAGALMALVAHAQAQSARSDLPASRRDA